MMNNVFQSATRVSSSLISSFKQASRCFKDYKRTSSKNAFGNLIFRANRPATRHYSAYGMSSNDLSAMPNKMEHLLKFVATNLEKVESCTEPRLEASLLIGIALKVPRELVIMDYKRMLTEKELDEVKEVLEKRKKEMPVALLSGFKNFFNSDFLVTSDTLIPRPATETLIEQTLELSHHHFSHHPTTQQDGSVPSLHLLELGVGSGCVIISLLQEFNRRFEKKMVPYRITGVGVDVNPKTLKVAKQNAARLGISSDQLAFYESNWTRELMEKHNVRTKYDILVSNPPYLTNYDWEVAPEVMRLYEPSIAFLGGQDGLDCYKQIYQQSHRILNQGALVCFEIGAWQAEDVKKIFTAENHFQFLSLAKDMDGHDRVISFLYQKTKESSNSEEKM